jgi:hypothetical protein
MKHRYREWTGYYYNTYIYATSNFLVSPPPTGSAGTLDRNAQTIGWLNLPWYGFNEHPNYLLEIIITTIDENDYIGVNIPNEDTLGTAGWNALE